MEAVWQDPRKRAEVELLQERLRQMAEALGGQPDGAALELLSDAAHEVANAVWRLKLDLDSPRALR